VAAARPQGAAHQVEGAHRARAQAAQNEKGFQRPKVPELQLAAAPRLSQTVIEAKSSFRKRFGERKIFSDVDLIVQPGERHRHRGPERRGQDDAGAHAARRAAARRAARSPSGRARRSPTTISSAPARRREDRRRGAWDDEWVTLGDQKVRLSDYLDDLLVSRARCRSRR
jgi:ATP-binding cassette subfamily F protein uup